MGGIGRSASKGFLRGLAWATAARAVPVRSAGGSRSTPAPRVPSLSASRRVKCLVVIVLLLGLLSLSSCRCHRGTGFIRGPHQRHPRIVGTCAPCCRDAWGGVCINHVSVHHLASPTNEGSFPSSIQAPRCRRVSRRSTNGRADQSRAARRTRWHLPRWS